MTLEAEPRRSAFPTVSSAPEGTVLTSLPRDLPVDRATAAARRVIDALLRTDREDPDLDRIADELERAAAHLEEHADDLDERMFDMWDGDGVARHDPVTGHENALAPPIVVRGRADGSVEGRVVLTLPYQGPPGYVHGGVSALLLDHVLGVANAWAGARGATAQLDVRYHRPVPLFEPLTVAARAVTRDGLKTGTVGEIRLADGTVCVSVDALFVDKTVPRPQRGS
ncbi:PaaI family thioesterase [Rhodococcus phenolicus]|uniref:PaaI family thioesterase n=1 Tax=Rhodococcus phenolicus TaxID=263849 RepID=UPI00083356A1|nr:PaaI family thioesterase [Rhodococcus phenolicus]